MTTSDAAGPDQTTRIATWMTSERCRQLISATRVSRVAFIADDRPQLVVLNHVVEGDGLVFQTSEATRLARLTADNDEIPVTIEVDSAAPSMHAGWSIVASGRLSRTTPDQVQQEPHPWRSDARGVLLRMTIDDIHGQVVGS